jgi:hypothetical protein
VPGLNQLCLSDSKQSALLRVSITKPGFTALKVPFCGNLYPKAL